ncbi:hypothetical protein pb186bvf_018768 [Paramecium bursaria]
MLNFTLDELEDLLYVDHPLAKSYLNLYKVKISDIKQSLFCQQELAQILNDNSLVKQCMDQYRNFKDLDLFLFIQKHVYQMVQFNILQMLPCFSCFKHTDYEESFKLEPDEIKNRIMYFSLKKIYTIKQLIIDFKENVQIKHVRIHISNTVCNLKDFQTSESFLLTQYFKPCLTVQSFGIEIIPKDEKAGACSCGQRKEFDENKVKCLRCGENLLFKAIQLVGYLAYNIEELQFQNESEIQFLKNIVLDISQIGQQKLGQLQNRYSQIKANQGVIKESTIVDMTHIYKEFNQAAVLSHKYQLIITQFYTSKKPQYSPNFSECVQCSRRYLQNLKSADSQLLREIYFDENFTQYEKETAISLLQPEPIEEIDLADENELLLQTELHIRMDNGVTLIDFYFEKILQQNFKEVIYKLLEFLSEYIRKNGTSNIQSFLEKKHMITNLIISDDDYLQKITSELILILSQSNDLLAVTILIDALEYPENFHLQYLCDNISINKSAPEIVDILIKKIRTKFGQIDKLLKYFQLIFKAWKYLSEQIGYYVQLDLMYNQICQQSCFTNGNLLDSYQTMQIINIYNKLYSSLTQTDSPQLLEYMVDQMFESNDIGQIQRISLMIHQIVFKKVEFKIKAVPNRATEEYVQKRHQEYSSLDIDTFEQLKTKLQNDIQIDMPFDFLIQNKLLDDTSKSVESVYKNFYLNEINRQEGGRSFSLKNTEEEILRKQTKELSKGRQLPNMIIEFSIRGIGGHDNMPYLPNVQDESKILLQQNFTKLIEKKQISGIFDIFHQMLNQNNKYMQTIFNIVDILKYISTSAIIKQEIVNCQGIILLLKIFLDNTSNIPLLDFLRDLLNQVQSAPNLRRRFSEQVNLRDLERYDKESIQNLKVVLQQLEKYNDDVLLNTLCQIIPLIIRDIEESVKFLLLYFKDKLSDQKQLNIFSLICQYNPKHYSLLRQMALDEGIYDFQFQEFQQQRQTIFKEGMVELIGDIMSMRLRIIFSVCKCSTECQQQLLDNGIIGFAVEMANNPQQKYKHISKVCESFVNYIKEEDILEDVKNEANSLMQSRTQMFKQISQQKKNKIMDRFSKNKFKDQLQIQVEKGFYCISCREGYSINNNLLGVYIYSIPYKIPDERPFFESQGKVVQEVMGIQSVTYFTIIHIKCHKKTVECAIRQHTREHEDQQRSNEDVEWEQAVKNNMAKCNNIFPIYGTNINIEQGFDQYLRRAERLFKCRGQKYWLCFNDLKGLFLRIAKLDDLSSDTGAGKQEHNMKLIPLYICVIAQYDYSPLVQLPLQFVNLDLLQVNIVSALFKPTEEWYQIKDILHSQLQEQYLKNAFYLVDLFHEHLLKFVTNKTNYREQLYTHLSTDEQVYSQIDHLERLFTKAVKN